MDLRLRERREDRAIFCGFVWYKMKVKLISYIFFLQL